MKKMLVSDYDGTLKSDIDNLKLNVKAIEKFKEQGNLFTIATGRTYSSIVKECTKFNIPYDYLICNDGLITIDKNGKIINSKELTSTEMLMVGLTVRNEEKVKDIHYYGLTDEVEMDDTLRNINKLRILEIGIQKKKLTTLKEYVRCMEEALPKVEVTKVGDTYYARKRYNKGLAVKDLVSKIDDLENNDVVTVGDASNDLEMLQMFDGRKVLTCYPSLYCKGIKTTREVHTLVKKMCK